MGPNIVECVIDALICEAWWPGSSILDSAIVNPGDTLRPCLRPRGLVNMPEDCSYLVPTPVYMNEEPLAIGIQVSGRSKLKKYSGRREMAHVYSRAPHATGEGSLFAVWSLGA
jgi:hypothetical protein